MFVGIAYEDPLSEALLDAILRQVAPELQVCVRLTHGGFGYLKRIAPGLNRSAAGMPYILIADLNHEYECAPDLLRAWLPGPAHSQFLLRVAVREVEAWVMADRPAFADFLGVARTKVPVNVEQLDDPKQTLVNLARRSRLVNVRRELSPSPGSTAKVGRGHNEMLTGFVRQRWRAREAQEHAPSLRRAVDRLAAFGQQARTRPA